MHNVIIADTSVLIALTNINELEILQKVYKTIAITPEVLNEFGETIPKWIKVEEVKDRKKIDILKLELDKGEASSLALAIEKNNCLLIIDERKGRKIAKRIGLNIIGLLGVLIKAKEQNIFSEIKPILEKLEKVDFRISQELKRRILKRIAENE